MVQSLKGMGALSDAEGKKLSDAVGALSPKMSEKAFRDSIGKIRNQLESKLSTVKNSLIIRSRFRICQGNNLLLAVTFLHYGVING